MTDEDEKPDPEPRKPPQIKISPGLYWLTGAILGMWVFVVFFFRNPYQQAVSGDYYDKNPYDESWIWWVILVLAPMLALAAYMAWRRRREG